MIIIHSIKMFLDRFDFSTGEILYYLGPLKTIMKLRSNIWICIHFLKRYFPVYLCRKGFCQKFIYIITIF